jgi:hypothetical protein
MAGRQNTDWTLDSAIRCPGKAKRLMGRRHTGGLGPEGGKAGGSRSQRGPSEGGAMAETMQTINGMGDDERIRK